MTPALATNSGCPDNQLGADVGIYSLAPAHNAARHKEVRKRKSEMWGELQNPIYCKCSVSSCRKGEWVRESHF